MRYAGHDVSNEPRDEDGKWTEGGGGSESEKSGSVVTRRPSQSGVITDSNGNAVGHFDFVSGWVTRAIRIGDAPVEKAVASIDDVVRALNSAKPPVSTDDWNEWFVSKGHPIASTGPTAPGYVPMRPRDDLDALVPVGELNALSGYDSEGKPRFYQASMTGPLVVKLIAHVCQGLLEKYAGDRIVGVAVNAAGKLVVQIAKRGKVFTVEVGDRVMGNFRRRVEAEAKTGTRDTRRLREWLNKSAPKPGWKSSLRGTTDENSKLLRRNMGDAIKPGEDAHHIVQSLDKRADEARILLDRFQIDINDAANGVGLKPTGDRPAHHGQMLHSNDAIARVSNRLAKAVKDIDDWSACRAELLKELDKLRHEILRGEFP